MARIINAAQARYIVYELYGGEKKGVGSNCIVQFIDSVNSLRGVPCNQNVSNKANKCELIRSTGFTSIC